MIRRATEADLPQIEDLLKTSVATTMFFRSNLRNAGLSGAKPNAMDVFVAQSGVADGVCGITRRGYMLAHANPEKTELWKGFADALSGYSVRGMTGAPEQVAAMLNALNAPLAALKIDELEPLYQADLANVPTFKGAQIRAALPKDVPLLNEWYLRSNIEILGGGDSDDDRSEAATQVRNAMQSGALRILESEGASVSMTGFNAILPDCVQIGGVYTPPEFRNRGYARQAVAMHLHEVRKTGVKRAILFAANKPACRAYEAIGFERVGDYRIALFRTPWQVAA